MLIPCSSNSIKRSFYVSTTVKALLFDLGGVVINISFERTFATLGQYAGIDPAVLKSRFIADDPYMRHERGEADAAEYFASLRQTFDVQLTDEQLLEGWNAIFLGEFSETVTLLRQLKTTMPLYAFSNINPSHKQFVMTHYPETLALFDRVFFSCDIGMRKPEPRAFAFVASSMGVAPAEVLFFDDSEANVTAAKAAGMQAVLVLSPADVAAAVTALGTNPVRS
jgi:glucose-1-phosphatase